MLRRRLKEILQNAYFISSGCDGEREGGSGVDVDLEFEEVICLDYLNEVVHVLYLTFVVPGAWMCI